jgi:K(+)-stimulated pyrophosphate-energized sodium pump
MQNYLIYIPVLGAAGLLLALFLVLGINRLPSGTIAADENAAQSGSLLQAFLSRYYIIATGGALVAFCILGFLYGWSSALCFLVGIGTALLLLHQTIANLQRAENRAAAAGSGGKAVAVLLCAASAVGLLAFSVVFLGCSLLFFCVGTPMALGFFVLGVALPALFYAVAGNFLIPAIKTETRVSEALRPEADSTADPILALLHSGTTVLDLCSSCTAALAGTMIIGALGMAQYGFGGVLLPLLIFAAAVPAYMIILLLIIILRNWGWLKATAVSLSLFALFMLGAALAAIKFLLPGEQMKIFLSFGAGWAAALILLLPWYFTPPGFFNKTRSYHMLISIPVLLLALALAYYTSGFYGIAIAVLAVILFTGIAVFMQTLNPMRDYSRGLIDGTTMENEEPADSEKVYQEIAAGRDHYDKPGSCFNICSAVLAAIVLLLAFTQMARMGEIPVLNGVVWLSLAIGGILPYLFSGWMAGEDRSPSEGSGLEGNEIPADEILDDVRDDFLGPDFSYDAYGESLLVLVMATAIPLLMGLLLGKQALTALLIGALVSAALLATLRVRQYPGIANLNLLLKFLLIVSLALVIPWIA